MLPALIKPLFTAPMLQTSLYPKPETVSPGVPHLVSLIVRKATLTNRAFAVLKPLSCGCHVVTCFLPQSQLTPDSGPELVGYNRYTCLTDGVDCFADSFVGPVFGTEERRGEMKSCVLSGCVLYGW